MLVEEEESAHDSAADVPTVSASVEGRKKAENLQNHLGELCLSLAASEWDFEHPHIPFLLQRASRVAALVPPSSPTAPLPNHTHPVSKLA